MTYLDWQRIRRHWDRFPTMRTMAWVGFHLEKTKAEGEEYTIPIADLLGDTPNGVISMDSMSAMESFYGR